MIVLTVVREGNLLRLDLRWHLRLSWLWLVSLVLSLVVVRVLVDTARVLILLLLLHMLTT